MVEQGDLRYEVTATALRHGVDEADVLHALRWRIRDWNLEAEPPERPDARVLVIGPARSGQLLEVIYAVIDTDYLVIHCMNVRSSIRDRYL